MIAAMMESVPGWKITLKLEILPSGSFIALHLAVAGSRNKLESDTSVGAQSGNGGMNEAASDTHLRSLAYSIINF